MSYDDDGADEAEMCLKVALNLILLLEYKKRKALEEGEGVFVSSRRTPHQESEDSGASISGRIYGTISLLPMNVSPPTQCSSHSSSTPFSYPVLGDH